MSASPELSRRIAVRSLGAPRLGGAGTEIDVEATPAECVRLARRLNLPSLDAFTCRFRLQPADAAGLVVAEGLLSAQLSQTCVVTLEDFPARVAEQFAVRFVPAERAPEGADLELDLEADDDILYMGGSIDLGEAATEQLALALDPYPRKPGAERPPGLSIGDPPSGAEPDPEPAPDAADAGTEARPNPFAALARLRRDDA